MLRFVNQGIITSYPNLMQLRARLKALCLFALSDIVIPSSWKRWSFVFGVETDINVACGWAGAAMKKDNPVCGQMPAVCDAETV